MGMALQDMWLGFVNMRSIASLSTISLLSCVTYPGQVGRDGSLSASSAVRSDSRDLYC